MNISAIIANICLFFIAFLRIRLRQSKIHFMRYEYYQKFIYKLTKHSFLSFNIRDSLIYDAYKHNISYT